MSMISPYPWQRPLVDFVLNSLKERHVAISGFPTGSGKTVIALAAAKILNAPHLVVCPKAAVTQWRRVADQMGAGHLLHGVVNPEKLSTPRGCEFYDKVGKWRLPPGTYVVWDEPHRGAGGKDSIQTKALAELRAYAAGLHAMSATVADSPLKLRALGFWLGMHQYSDGSFYAWCRKHGCTFQSPSRDMRDAGRKVLKFTTDPLVAREHMLAIRREMGSVFMSMKAEDIPGFPEQALGVKYVDLNKDDRKAIEDAYETMSDRMKSRARSWMAETSRERERIEYTMAPALAELAEAHVAEGLSPATFFNFTEPRLRFEETLRNLGVHNIASVHGGQKEEDRQKMIDEFQANRLWAASIMVKAGGAALSLHDVRHERSRVGLIVPAYEADLIKQALGRIRRCEGTPVVQHFVIAAGTAMEAVASRLECKMGNIDALNDGDMSPLAPAS